MSKYVYILALLLPIFLIGQKKKNRDTSAVILQPDRIEFEKESDNSDFFVISGGEKGILVVEQTNQNAPRGNGSVVNLHMLDTTFNVTWSKTHIVQGDGAVLGYEYFDGKFYLLFSKDRYRSTDLIVYQLNSKNEEYIFYEITTVFPIELTHFESVGETLLLAGYANFRPVVITYNINDRVPRVVPGFYDNKNDILDLVVDEQAKLFTVIMSERMRNKKFTVRVKTFTDRGDIIQDNLLNPGDKMSLLDGASTTFSGGLQYLAGTHSRKSNQYSQGFYLSKFINGQQQFNKYYPFADLSNFWDHLKPKREQRILRRIERKKQKGKVKKFNYRLLVHKILEVGDEYIMVAEAYYPRYNHSSPGSGVDPYWTFNNNSTSQFNPFFLGYKYTHAVVVAFDRNCNILWDHTFKIEDIQNYSLEENVAVSVSDGRLILMYLEENEIRSKVVEANEVIEGRTFNPVKLSYESDELKSRDSSVEKVEKWYDANLFAYGEQNIRNPVGVNGKTYRKVFYINKIQYTLDRDPN